MKGREELKESMKGFLDNKGGSEEVFGERYEKGEKNMDDWVSYVVNWVESRGWWGFCDDEIYGECIDFFDEEKMEIGKEIEWKVVVNDEIELSEEEKGEGREKGMGEYEDEEIEKMKKGKKGKGGESESIVGGRLLDL